MGYERHRKQSGGRPANQQRDRSRQQRTDPAEIASDAALSLELGVALRRQCAGEKDSEEKEDDAANLARERGRRRLIVPVRARAS